MIALLSLLCLQAPTPTAPTPAQPTPAAPGPAAPRGRLLDGVAVQAGEEVVTLSQYERLLKHYAEQRPPQSRQDELDIRRDALQSLWMQRLEEQNGRDLGLDPAQIGRMRRGILKEERERTGLETYLAGLKAEGADALSNESEREGDILRYLWEQATLGKPYGGKRATQDDFVRPGELREIFAQSQDALAATTVQLRVLMISSQHAGSPEAARQACEDARARVEAGEDLAAIVDERGDGMRGTRGLTDYMPPDRVIDPVLQKFASEAEVGGMAETMAIRNPKTGQPDESVGFQLVQLADRRIPPPPEFSSREIQRRLNDYFQRQHRAVVLGRAGERLRRESYSWVSPLVTGPAPDQDDP